MIFLELVLFFWIWVREVGKRRNEIISFIPDSIRHLAFTHLGLILAYISNSSLLVSLLISSFFFRIQLGRERRNGRQNSFYVLNKITQETGTRRRRSFYSRWQHYKIISYVTHLQSCFYSLVVACMCAFFQMVYFRAFSFGICVVLHKFERKKMRIDHGYTIKSLKRGSHSSEQRSSEWQIASTEQPSRT